MSRKSSFKVMDPKTATELRVVAAVVVVGCVAMLVCYLISQVVVPFLATSVL